MEVNNRPLLSICIPTYNRAEELKKTLRSITYQVGNTSSDIEVVVSDNASIDNTEGVVSLFCEKYDYIKYFRNDNNIAGINFAVALKRGRGIYRKLLNDTVDFHPKAIESMKEIIVEYMKEKPVIYWNMQNTGDERCHSIEELIYKVSYGLTWIGGIGIWEDEEQTVENHCRSCAERYGKESSKWRKEESGQDHFWQVRYVLDRVDEKGDVVLVDIKDYFYSRGVKKHFYQGYITYLFGQYYLSIIKQYADKNKITNKCYEWEKKDLFFNFLLNYVLEYEYPDGSMEFEGDIKQEVFELAKLEPFFGGFVKDYKRKKNGCFVLMKKNQLKRNVKALIGYRK